MDAACDLGHQHMAARLVHPLAAAARRDHTRPPPTHRHPRGPGPVHPPPGLAPSGPGEMSEASVSPERGAGAGAGGRLPRWLRPRAVELPGSGRTRLIETTLLVLAGLLLAIATVNDVGRQVNVNHRLIADEHTWRSYTGHDYHTLSVDQKLLGEASRKEVVCGNTSPGGPKERTQLCLAIC